MNHWLQIPPDATGDKEFSSILKTKARSFFFINLAFFFGLLSFLFIHHFYKSYTPHLYYLVWILFIINIGVFFQILKGRITGTGYFFVAVIFLAAWQPIFSPHSPQHVLNQFDSIIYIYILSITALLFLEKRSLLYLNLANLVLLTAAYLLSPAFDRLPEDAAWLYYIENLVALGFVTVVSFFLQRMSKQYQSLLLVQNQRLTAEIEEKRAAQKRLEETNLEMEAAYSELQAASEQLEESNEDLLQTNLRLEVSQNRLENLFLNAPYGVLILQSDTVILEVNTMAEEIIGMKKDKLIGNPLGLRSPETQPSGERSMELIRKVFAKALAGSLQSLEWTFLRGDERRILYVRTSHIPLQNEKLLLVFIHDITELKKNQDFLHLMQSILDFSAEGMLVTNREAKIILSNPALSTITGYSQDELLGQNPRIFQSNYHSTEYYQEFWRTLTNTGQWHGEIWNRRKNGEIYPSMLHVIAIRDEDNHIDKYVGITHDITELKESQSKVLYIKNYDPLTGLPNKNLFMDRLRLAIERKKENEQIALILLGLDSFNYINHSFGYTVGDDILKQFSKTLKMEKEIEYSLARIGGDIFGFMVYDIFQQDDLIKHLNLLQNIQDKSFAMENHEIFLKFCTGVSLHDQNEDAYNFYQKSYSALLRAKEMGAGQIQFFTDQMTVQISKRLNMENRLRKAIGNREIVVHYQPKIDIRTQQVTGMEALVRWHPPDLGMIPPGEFISLCEETGLIHDIGEEVLRQAAAFLKIVNSDRTNRIRSSVNVSVVQLLDLKIKERFLAIIQEAGIPITDLELEITESSFLNNNTGMQNLISLAQCGFPVSLDDFGTGYSSLSYLKDMPFHTLKIDQSFIRDIAHNPRSQLMLQSILELAKRMHLFTVAEGVEQKEQLQLLSSLGCDQIQGFLFARPMPADEFLAYLKKDISELFWNRF